MQALITQHQQIHRCYTAMLMAVGPFFRKGGGLSLAALLMNRQASALESLLDPLWLAVLPCQLESIRSMNVAIGLR